MEKQAVILNHPLIQHKLSILRDVNTSTKEFRDLINEIAMLMIYDATRDLPLESKNVQTPCGVAHCKEIAGRKLAFVPILRAGLGMVEGALQLVPSARVGHIGLYRNETTLEPVEYYCKLPKDIQKRDVFVVDPMLATGGSAIDAIGQIKKRNPRSIKFLCIIAAPEGLEALSKAHPDVQIYAAGLDDHLDESGYIVPGLGDAGDRIFGTK
ncbi:MAG: uracil phosphoribosyltransferase [Clostridiales bacterium]|nr:uracil phosphoribosyltransferase [Clostridiales bacterium]